MNYPHVTEIIRVLKGPLDEPFFQTEKGKAILENKAAHGTLVHDLIEQHIIGEFDADNFLMMPESVKDAFNVWREWANKNVEKFLHSEKGLVSKKHGYQGRMDAVLIVKGEKNPCVVDWKTSQAIDIPYLRMQTAAYHNMAQENGLIEKPVRRLCVQIGEKIKVVEFKKTEQQNDFVHFLYCLNLKKFKRE